MKRTSLYLKCLLTGLFLVSFTLLPVVSQVAKNDSTVQKPKSSIPAEVQAVFANSCLKCHGEGGRARAALDFTKWEAYTAEMKAHKAKEIIQTVSNGSMPPKNFTNANPGAVVLKEQVELIRKWSDTFIAKK